MRALCILIGMVAGLSGAFITPGAHAAIVGPWFSPWLSGSSAFRGSFQDRQGRFFSFSGTLDFDWLGDISGEASAHRRGGETASGTSCHTMIEGSYKRTQDSQIVDGIIEVIPVDGSCGMRLNKFHSWRIDIIPGPMLGDFDLVQRPQSAPWFVGVAKPKPGLVS